MHFCRFKFPSLWSLVTAAPETNRDREGHRGPLQGHGPAGEGQQCRSLAFFPPHGHSLWGSHVEERGRWHRSGK